MTTSKPKLRTGTRMSADEYLALPEIDEYRWLELDDGELYFMPRPRRGHLFVSSRLTNFFENHLDRFGEPPAEVYSELVIIISRESGRILIPDLSIFIRPPGDDTDISAAGNIPDIVIEILSTDRNRDLVRKRQLYAEAGVPEYWIFDPRQRHRPPSRTQRRRIPRPSHPHGCRNSHHAPAARPVHPPRRHLPPPSPPAP